MEKIMYGFVSNLKSVGIDFDYYGQHFFACGLLTFVGVQASAWKY